MSDKYESLLYENNLYSAEMINQFGRSHVNWERMGSREKELLMRNITVITLLCNMELIEEKETSKKRKRTLKKKEKPVAPLKHSRIDRPGQEDEFMHPRPGTSQSTTTVSSSTSSSTETSVDDLMDLEEEIKSAGGTKSIKYRMTMIKYQPSPESRIREISARHMIPCPTRVWDVFDNMEHNFIDVLYDSVEGAQSKFEVTQEEIPENSAYIRVDPATFQASLHGISKQPRGLAKVQQFLTLRLAAINELNILETEAQNAENLENFVNCSKHLKTIVGEWETDFLTSLIQHYSKEELYKKSNSPKTIHPSVLIQYLDDPNNPTRNGTVRWKGKLLPEGFVFNIETQEKLDSSMIDLFFKEISGTMRSAKPYTVGYEENDITMQLKQVGVQLINCWEGSTKNSFTAITNPQKMPEEIKVALGIGAKTATFDPSNEEMVQKEFKGVPTLKYSPWIEEVYKTLGQQQQWETTPFPELLESPYPDNHPISKITEKATTFVFEKLLKTNTALYASKITNMYSRLGGAYKGGKFVTNQTRRSISYFPIYGVLGNTKVAQNADSKSNRLIHGVCIRGAQHARSPTDKVNIVTIEAMPNSAKAKRFIKILNKGIIYQGEDIIVVVRQNAILKEDPSYNTFVINSLFNVINTLGFMTIENNTIKQYENMDDLIQKTFLESLQWFIDRFTDGILWATIANSRDEGYFSSLRKLFMVVLMYRRDELSANWDIETFCNKANECLTDNPLSMYFQKYLLEVLKLYDIMHRTCQLKVNKFMSKLRTFHYEYSHPYR